MSDEKLSYPLEAELQKLCGLNNFPIETAFVLRPLLARLEREKERWRRAIEGLTPSGSEFYNDPDYCAEYIRKRTQYPKMIIELREQVARLERERAAARREALADAAQEADKQARMASAVTGHCNCNEVVASRIRAMIAPSVVSQPSREREVLLRIANMTNARVKDDEANPYTDADLEESIVRVSKSGWREYERLRSTALTATPAATGGTPAERCLEWLGPFQCERNAGHSESCQFDSSRKRVYSQDELKAAVAAGKKIASVANENLCARITDYLSKGGLFNPESMNGDMVRDLIMDCYAALTAPPASTGGTPR